MRIAIVLCIFSLTACNSSNVPADFIQPKKMVPLVYDMIRADELVNNYVLRDTALKSKNEHIKMYEQVFLIHQTTRNQFYKSLKYYQQHPDISKALFDSITAHTTNEQQKALNVHLDSIK